MSENNYMQEVLKHFDENFFGKLTEYVADIDVTDINCNSRDVWINHVKNGRYKVDIDFTEEDIKALAYRVSNTENVQFNANHPTLEADLYDLRFHFTHDSFSTSGTSCSIRKTPVTNRIHKDHLQDGKVHYLSKEANNFLMAAVRSKLNIFICGLTGSGKTELAKYLMGYTLPSERIITIEDTSELHLAKIYPEKDVVELKINEFIDYEKAIKSCMRMLPIWVLLSESRGKEVKELLKCISTGAKIISTLHVDDARQIPYRILNMFEDNELSNERIETMIYDYIDIGVHLSIESGKETIRYVDQIVYFELDKSGNKTCYEIYTVKKDVNGNYEYIFNEIPKSLKEKLYKYGFYH